MLTHKTPIKVFKTLLNPMILQMGVSSKSGSIVFTAEVYVGTSKALIIRTPAEAKSLNPEVKMP